MNNKKKRDILVSVHTLSEHYLLDERRPQYVIVFGRKTEITPSIILRYGDFIVKMKALDEHRNPVYILEKESESV